jgi:hypothetical protein
MTRGATLSASPVNERQGTVFNFTRTTYQVIVCSQVEYIILL